MEKRRILITGGAGFVGSHLCDRLVREGYKVVCLDNLYTGSMDNIKHISKDIEFVKMDITENDILNLSKYGFTEIYNLACPASPVHYQADPIGVTMACTLGMKNILELATMCGAKILQASTSEVYGNPLEHPQKETYFGNVNPCGVRSCYDEGKRCAESLCFDYNRKYGTDVKVVRIFNTYGERMAVNDGRVVSNFIVQALNGEPITIYGDGKQTRSFQYVSDLVEGMIAMMNSNQHGPINIGNPQEYTMNKLAEKIIELTGSKSEIVYKELPSDDPLQRRPDISKAKELIDWEPNVDIDEGLKKTIEYFKQKPKNMNNLYVVILATSKYNEYLPFFFKSLKFLKFRKFNIHPIVISDKKYFGYDYYPIAHLPYPFASYLKLFIIQHALEHYNCDTDDYMMFVDADTMIRKKDNYNYLEYCLLSGKMLFSISPWSTFNYQHENSLCEKNYSEVYINNIKQDDFLQASFFAGKISSFYDFNKMAFDLVQELTKDWKNKRIPPMIDQSIITKVVHDNQNLFIKDYFLVDDYSDYKITDIDNIPDHGYYCNNTFRLRDYNTVFLIQKFNPGVKKDIRYSI